MKNLYSILSRNEVHLCYQVASSEKEAISLAKIYGIKGVSKAVFVRENY